MKKYLFAPLKFALAGGVIYYLIASGRLDLTAVARIFSSPLNLLLFFFLIGFNIFCNTWRWQLLLQCQEINLTLWQTARVNFIGLFFNTFLPGAVSGDLVKGYYLHASLEKGHSRAAMMMTILLDRFLGVATLSLMSLVGALYGIRSLDGAHQLYPLVGASASLFLGMFLFGAFSLSPWLYAKGFIQKLLGRLPGGSIFIQLYEAIFAYHRFPKRLLAAHIISILGQAAFVLSFYIAYRSSGGTSIPIAFHYFLVPLGMLTTAVPLFPGGLGIGQAAFLQLFQMATLSQTTGGADAFTVIQLVYFLWNMVGVIFYLQGKLSSLPALTHPSPASGRGVGEGVGDLSPL